jgi:hypothetical protein
LKDPIIVSDRTRFEAFDFISTALTIKIHIKSNTFRTAVENKSQVRKLIEPPEVFKPLPEVKDGKLGDIPTIADLGVEDKTLNPDVRSAFPFKGGETAAVERLNYYYWKSECVAKYKETRNGLIGEVSWPVKFLYPFVLKMKFFPTFVGCSRSSFSNWIDIRIVYS